MFKILKKKSDNTITIYNPEVLQELNLKAQKQSTTIDDLASTILCNYLKNKESQVDLAELRKQYILLDKYLFSTLNRKIKIGITKDEIGRENKMYILKDYKMSLPDRSITLKLERKEDIYPITFYNIKEIGTQGTDELKTWLYMDDQTWKFYLNFNCEILQQLDDNHDSKMLILERESDEYEKYKFSNPLLYHTERYKSMFKNDFVDEKAITLKSGEEIMFINTCYKSPLDDKEDGTIYLIGKRGKLGELFYEIVNLTDQNEKLKRIELVDIQHSGYNLGIGSAVLQYLDEIATKNEVSYIIGELAPEDLSDHKERLFHFYTENNYEIRGNSIYKNFK